MLCTRFRLALVAGRGRDDVWRGSARAMSAYQGPEPGRPEYTEAGYATEEIGAYGISQQPAIVARMAPELRMIQIGTVSALLGVVCALLALLLYPVFTGGSERQVPWPGVALAAALVMLAIAVIQLMAWRRAFASWRGEKPQDLHGEARLSWIAHLASYVVVLVTLLSAMAGSADATWDSTASAFLALTLLFVVAAQVLAGVQFLRASGPPGTLPAHMRRLIQRSREKEDLD